MRRLVAGLFALAAATQGAGAADLPIGPPVVRPAQAILFSWSGFYVGVHAGGGRAHKDFGGVPYTFGGNVITPQPFDLKASGALAGVQAGINFQTGIWVFGAEAQASWSNLKASTGCTSFSSAGAVLAATCDARVDTLATFALRVGVALDRLLVFGKAGLGLANDRYTSNAANTVIPLIFDANETRWGWMAGIGLEYAFLDSWSAKIEYNHIDLGTRSVRWTDAASTVFYLADVRQTVDLVKVGINYRFGVSPVAVRH